MTEPSQSIHPEYHLPRAVRCKGEALRDRVDQVEDSNTHARELKPKNIRNPLTTLLGAYARACATKHEQDATFHRWDWTADRNQTTHAAGRLLVAAPHR